MAVQGSRKNFIYITGCDTGFGNILTRKLDNLGFSVIPGCYLEESLGKLRNECSENVYPVRVDVSDENSVNSVAQEIASILDDKNGVLHGVVNNAGILVQPGPVEWTPSEAYHRMFNVNVMGTVLTTKSLLPLLRKSRGRIVNVASIAGRVGLPLQPAYCMSKFGVEGYSEVLRMDVYNWGISVHIIEPGIFKATGLYDSYQAGMKKLWEDLDDNTREAYGEKYYQAIRKGLKAGIGMGSAKSEMVVDAMVEALTSKKPKYRYRVGGDSKYFINMVERTHESVQDGVIGGLWRTPGVIPSGASLEARKEAYDRYHKAWGRFLVSTLAVGFGVQMLRGKL